MINRALLGVATTSSPSDEPTLDQLLAEPIVQQLMRRDSIDEATIRQLLQETASARLASRAEDDLEATIPTRLFDYHAGHYGRIVAGCEMMVGVAFTALTTGLLFVRSSRPKAQIRYAKNTVIATHNGQPTLMIRIANARLSLISDASVHLGLMRTTRGAEGQLLRRIYELPLIRSRLPLFTLIWTVMHRIDKSSPLFGYDAARLIEDDVHMWISVEGHDSIFATTIMDIQAYGPAEILYGMRYVGSISADAEGHSTVDLRELSQIEPDTGPEPLQSGLVDAR